MRQVIQNVGAGQLSVRETPDPVVRRGQVLIANYRSLVSAGTEKMVRDLSKKSLLGKARQRPDQVRRVLEKIRNEGLFNTIRQVREKLDAPMPMGYSSAGIVLAVGEDVQGYQPGDRVASNGPHAEIVCVPKHLCARVPAKVDWDQAAFTVLGAIALQGIRLAKVELGETVLVVGLGLVGQLTVGLLRAAGCRVLGVDPDAGKCALALQMGAEVAETELSAADVERLTGGLGSDAVVITASTASNGPIELAAAAVRKKGRVVLVGVVGLQLNRQPFFEKECEFVVSCSYGPGRYDARYEQRGIDYPAAYVRWTEQRNMTAVLAMIDTGRLDVSPLISHRFTVENAEQAYALMDSGAEPYLGMLLTYPEVEQRTPQPVVQLRKPALARPGTSASGGKLGVGVLGAGNFARLVLLPLIAAETKFRPVMLGSAGGSSAMHSGQKHGFDRVTSEEDELIHAPDVEAVFIVTQHDQHARQVLKSLRAGKSVFVEKPLCLTTTELAEIEAAIAESPGQLLVGYNRRFSPAAVEVQRFFSAYRGPKTISLRFNAGAIPADHWLQDPDVGGGRIIGEACHGIDLATFLAGAPPVRVFAQSIGGAHSPEVTDDQCFLTLQHADGSISSIAYLAGGDKAFPKERVEVFGGGQVAVIEDFRQVTTASHGKLTTGKIRAQDKGHAGEIAAWAHALREGGPAPIAWEDLRATSLTAMLAMRSMREGYPLSLLDEPPAASQSES